MEEWKFQASKVFPVFPPGADTVEIYRDILCRKVYQNVNKTDVKQFYEAC